MARLGSPKITSINRRYQHCDEPQFYQYSTTISLDQNITKHTGSGFSFFSDNLAQVKCLSEAYERLACDTFDINSFTKSSFNEFRLKEALNPVVFYPFSQEQKEIIETDQLRLTKNDKFYWTEVLSYPGRKEYCVPAQLVYTKFIDKNEKIIRFPISTGAAANFSLDSALYGGICEIVERDSFMIAYLNKVCRCKLDLTSIKNSKIQFLINKARRYLIDVNIFDITTDLNIPSFLTVVIDKSGYGLAVSTGLKADLNSDKAIEGSLQEAFHTRSWIRSCVESGDLNVNIKTNQIKTIKDRGAFWFNIKRIIDIEFFLNLEPQTYMPKKLTNGSSEKSKLDVISKIIMAAGMKIYYKDLTLDQLKRFGYWIVKVLVPELQPLYLNDRYPYLGNKRIYDVPVKLGLLKKTHLISELNTFPHPFL